MDRPMERNERIRRECRQTRLLLTLSAVMLFCGLFAQIAIRAQISGQAKEIAAVQAEIRAMTADAENLSLCINQHHDLVAIEKRATALGLTQPTEDQLRQVSLPSENASAQTAANVDGEELNG